ncbi:VOC family protein [Kribbella jejuensis]|nr:VOC family protein [Kribbella jejuensis]
MTTAAGRWEVTRSSPRVPCEFFQPVSAQAPETAPAQAYLLPGTTTRHPSRERSHAPSPRTLPPADARPTRLHLDESDRTHLDLWVEDSTQEAEVDRQIGLGAERIEWNYPPDADFVVLKAPDGTVFCVIS